MNQPVLGFAIVGFGAWGQIHADTILSLPGIELRAVVTSASADTVLSRLGRPLALCTSDLTSVLARDDIEVVCIVTPNGMHEAQAIAALRAGKHVLLEKPMALHSEACIRINAAARAAGKTVNVVHQLRMSAQYGDIRQWIASGRIGDPLGLHFNLFRRSFRSGSGGWRYRPDMVGSWLLEELIHYVDLATWYFQDIGLPTRVTAAGNSRSGVASLYDNFTMNLHWPSGEYAALSQCLAGFEHHKSMEVIGSRGVARAVWSGVMDRTDAPSATLHRLEGLRGDERFDVGTPIDVALGADSGEVAHLRRLIAGVADSVRTGVPLVSGEDGATAVRLCTAAMQAASTGHSVELALDPK